MSKINSFVSKYVNPTVLRNSGWLIWDKVIAAAISFVVYFATANYLGVESLGVFNYSLSVVTVLASFATLGLDSLIVKDILDGKYSEKSILGSVRRLRVLGSVLIMIMSLLVVWISKHDLVISTITIVLSSSYLLRSYQVLDPWFLAKKNVKPSVVARVSGVVVSALIKIILVIGGFDVVYFAVATLLEALFIACSLILSYRRISGENVFKWKFDKKYVQSLFSRGWMLILGVILAALASRLDQYLLGTMQSDSAVGLYSPAAKLSEYWYAIPIAFLEAMYPGLIEAKNLSKEVFTLKLKRVIVLLFYISIIFCLLMSLFSDEIITLLLKDEFIGAGEVLRIYVWGTLGTVMTSLLLRWLLVMEKGNQVLIATSMNVILNLILNLVLVPRVGITGAAWATAISYNVGWCFVAFVLNRRDLGNVILEAIFMPWKLL